MRRLDVKAAIIRKGLYQYEIVQELGVSENVFSKFIRGHGNLRPEQVGQLMGILGLENSTAGLGHQSVIEAINA